MSVLLYYKACWSNVISYTFMHFLILFYLQRRKHFVVTSIYSLTSTKVTFHWKITLWLVHKIKDSIFWQRAWNFFQKYFFVRIQELSLNKLGGNKRCWEKSITLMDLRMKSALTIHNFSTERFVKCFSILESQWHSFESWSAWKEIVSL